MNENAPTLVVLAAGMGSRYGGLKQFDAMGPHGDQDTSGWAFPTTKRNLLRAPIFGL